MKNSSAAQPEPQYPMSTTATTISNSSDQIDEVVGQTTSADLIGDAAHAIAPLKAPTFGNWASIYAITSRRAGRLNATKITSEEHVDLLRERQTLLDKKFAEKITKREANRLEYVRWSLDRIEDARHGEALDALESAVGRYEQLESELLNLKEQLLQAVDSERQRQQGNRRR